MDNLLENGDMVLNQNAEIITVSSVKETIQRILICLMIKKGDFTLTPNLGSNIHSVDINTVDEFTLIAIITDALSGINGVLVRDLKKNIDYQKQTMDITLFLNIDGSDTEIIINNSTWG